MARTTRLQRRNQALRRKRVWARVQEASLGVDQTGAVINLGAGFQADMGTTHLPPGITIGGILLDMAFERATAATDAATSQLQIGVGVFDEPTPAEVPRPLDEPHADWMWQQMIAFPAPTAGALTSTFDRLGGPIRIRAKRRAEEINQDLYLVLQGYDIAPTFNVQVFASALLLLP